MEVKKPMTLAGMLLTAALMQPGMTAGLPDPPEFHASLLPALSQIEIGDTAHVHFEVDETAVQFNGYEVTIQWNPEVVQFLSPPIEGQLMIDGCPSFRWQTIETTDSTVYYLHILMCADSSLVGPGRLSTYRFQALANGISPIEVTSNPDSVFLDAGPYVNPDHPSFPRQVILHNGEIRVGDVHAVPEVRGARRLLLEQNVPNPFNPSTSIGFQIPEPGAVRLAIFDAGGRLVWRRSWDYLVAGRHRLDWFGNDTDGRAVASGSYVYRLTTPTASVTRRMTLVR
jgi:hypothetical protein